jgi:MFS family permease
MWALANGLLPFGAIFGALVSGLLADVFGRYCFGLILCNNVVWEHVHVSCLVSRLKSLMLINMLLILSVFMTGLTINLRSLRPFLAGRFLYGPTCSLFSGVASIYLFEIAPRRLRGAAGTMHQLVLTLGLTLVNVFGLPMLLGTIELWRHLYTIMLVIVLLHVSLLPFCVETLKFVYIKRNDTHEAETSRV